MAATASPQSARLRRGYGGQAVHSSESAIHRPLRGRGDGGDRARGHNWLKLLKTVEDGLGRASVSNRRCQGRVARGEGRAARGEWNFVRSALDACAWMLGDIRRCVLNPADCIAIIRNGFGIFWGGKANAPLAEIGRAHV